MTINEFLTLIGPHPFILYYYAFSMILSIVMGRYFLSRMGHPRIWNYFFSLLLYVMSVLGMFSLILFAYQWITNSFVIAQVEVLIPFLTMIVALWLIRSRVNVSLLTGFGSYKAFYIVLFSIALCTFLLDETGLLFIFDWPLYLFMLFLVVITLVIQRLLHYLIERNKN